MLYIYALHEAASVESIYSMQVTRPLVCLHIAAIIICKHLS